MPTDSPQFINFFGKALKIGMICTHIVSARIFYQSKDYHHFVLNNCDCKPFLYRNSQFIQQTLV